jgi:ATP-dependent DNA helicase DinG
MTLVDPYELTDDTDALLARFDATIVSRGQHRVDTTPISRVSDTAFSVPGDPKLGDARSFYIVYRDGRFWRCHCAKANGHNICSHITAVLTAMSSGHLTVDAPSQPVTPAVALRLGEPSTPVVSSTIPSPTDRMFGKPAIPAQFTAIRPHQWDAVQDILEQFATNDLVMVDAPTGSGKTLIAELARRLSGTGRAAYICSSIQLQQQFTADFRYSREVKGRSNYDTLSGHDGITCADCTATPPADPTCFWCDDLTICPYRKAKASAQGAELAVLNTSYFLHATNYAKEFGDRQLVIVDECDVLEKELMGFVEVTISERIIAELDLGMPAKVTIPESWATWMAGVLPKVKTAYLKMPAKTDDVKMLRRRRNLEQLHGKLKLVSEGLLDGNWVFDDYQQGRATFRPIRVDGFGAEYLWPHGKKWLLMSATIVSPDTLAESLGWDKPFGVVKVPHTFAKENRPVRIVPVASVTNKNKETAYPALGNALTNLARIHEHERMLVHTVSYELTRYLEDFLRQRVPTQRIFTYTKAAERERVLAKFKKTDGGILLAPSMDRGVDLPGDDAQVVVVAKIPFLSLGSKQATARLHSRGGQQWYSVEAIRSLVQMCGRHVRSRDDVGITYILDQQFMSNVWAKNRSLIPGWFKDALVFDHPKREIVSEA